MSAVRNNKGNKTWRVLAVSGPAHVLSLPARRDIHHAGLVSANPAVETQKLSPATAVAIGELKIREIIYFLLSFR